MELDPTARSRIEAVLDSHSVVLFMKGTRAQPQCGFSARTTQILDILLPEYASVDVLGDAEIREGIKAYSQWPTIPQLYINREFVGGCDIVSEMFEHGELHELVGLELPSHVAPKIELTEAARELFNHAIADQPDKFLQLNIDARWNPRLALGPDDGQAIKVRASGIELQMDPTSAQRANGLKIDVEESLHGPRFKFDNPNAPPPVREIIPAVLKEMMDSGDIVHLYDVRPPEERAKASIRAARPLDEVAVQEIEALDKETVLVFHCHLGGRSREIAEHFRLKGFTNVLNLEGGIDRWSLEIDPTVLRY